MSTSPLDMEDRSSQETEGVLPSLGALNVLLKLILDGFNRFCAGIEFL